METVPKIITTKDLLYLADMFNWNMEAFKQIHHFETEVENEEIKELMHALAEMHYQHMEWIISILKKEDDEETDEEEDMDDEEFSEEEYSEEEIDEEEEDDDGSEEN